MENNDNVFLGIGIGISLGLILGLLIAPEKGSDTYRKIEEAIREVAGDFRKLGRQTS